MADRFKGLSAVVTGGGHGIGGAIANRLAAEGAAVTIIDFHRERAEAKAAEIEKAGGRATAQAADVRQREQIEAAIDAAIAKFGTLDVVVNAAGIMDRSPFLDTDDALWRRVIDTNLTGTFLVGQVAARRMRASGKGGSIVNIASGSGILGGQGRAAYGASKAGVMNLTQTMAIELAPHAIRVDGVPLHRVEQQAQFESGTYLVDGRNVLVAFDPAGPQAHLVVESVQV